MNLDTEVRRVIDMQYAAIDGSHIDPDEFKPLDELSKKAEDLVFQREYQKLQDMYN